MVKLLVITPKITNFSHRKLLPYIKLAKTLYHFTLIELKDKAFTLSKMLVFQNTFLIS